MYNLYYGKLQQIPENCVYTFCNINKRRVLVFSEEIPLGDFVIVPEDLYHLLSPEEKTWFANAKIEINKKHLQINKDKYLSFLSKLVKDIEDEVQKIEEKGNEQ